MALSVEHSALLLLFQNRPLLALDLLREALGVQAEAAGLSDPTIDEHYEAARTADAIGRKLIGGGGFFMFYAMPADRRRFRFESGGASIVANIRQS